MRKSMERQQQIGEVVTQFAGAYMSSRPESVLVDLHDGHVLVTLRQVVCPAEREYAPEHSSRERLERLFSETFDTVKTEPETAGAGINLMSIQDFVAISRGKYVRNNLEFGGKLGRFGDMIPPENLAVMEAD